MLVVVAAVCHRAVLVGMPVIPLVVLEVVRALVVVAGRRLAVQRGPVIATALRAPWVKAAPALALVVAVVGTTAAAVAAAIP